MCIDDRLPDGAIRPLDKERAIAASVCDRPDFRPLASAVRIAVSPRVAFPFRVFSGTSITVHPEALGNAAIASVLLRHALELALWLRLTGGAGRSEEREAAVLLSYLRIPVIARCGSGAKAPTDSGRWRPGVPADDVHSARGQPRLAAG